MQKKQKTNNSRSNSKLDYDMYSIWLQTPNNKTKTYALPWEQYTKGMKNRIEARSNFEYTIENNPIELFKTFKEQSMNHQKNCYAMSIILDPQQTLFNTRQQPNETLQDYTKKFRSAKDIFESHLRGLIILQWTWQI